MEYKKITKKELFDKCIKLNKLIDDMEYVKHSCIDMDYSDCYLIDENEWKTFMNHQEDHHEELEREAEETDFWKQESKKLKDQMDQQHKELQEIKDKLKELLN